MRYRRSRRSFRRGRVGRRRSFGRRGRRVVLRKRIGFRM